MHLIWTQTEDGWVLATKLGKVELNLMALTRQEGKDCWLVTTGDGYWPEIQGYHHEGTWAECLDWAKAALAAHGLGWPGNPKR